ncbi:thioredoxin family protein [Oliverpabstia sp.]|uniref:thioredoxin family protein n=1 Tax=Oliverpabstia sp. TaxID=2815798 RepID=UPI00258F26B3|nr:thioredoxin domain-containing protein [Oliverpabstia sp.]MCI7526435.1 thioredoxin family protein [Oliverpabstia sp.]
MPILLLRKRKLRHSLGRPSRSDFVQPVVVEFYTTACSHCKKLAGALNKLSEEKGDDVFFGKCNIDQEALLQSRFDISAVPTLLFIKNGEIKNRLVGEVHPLIIQEEIKKLA